ncbi:MAG: hypothetical protein COT85_02655 [Chlamydiae bacterium CG10_big_fil_rev_8_21_14_0_10_42_34]|nr:MAG: hypothetical protein COT85_02655 [Chlamydiae bacterium CG10_big_fil_rev_8_21_14_0_10_42_34]
MIQSLELNFNATKGLFNKEPTAQNKAAAMAQKVSYVVASAFVAIAETFLNAAKAVANGVIFVANKFSKPKSGSKDDSFVSKFQAGFVPTFLPRVAKEELSFSIPSTKDDAALLKMEFSKATLDSFKELHISRKIMLAGSKDDTNVRRDELSLVLSPKKKSRDDSSLLTMDTRKETVEALHKSFLLTQTNLQKIPSLFDRIAK